MKRLLQLEWKSFFRSASFKMNIVLKILLGFAALMMMISFFSLGAGSYFIIKKELDQDPLVVVNQLLIFYVVFDLVFRYFLQKMPIINIRPLLYLPIKKGKVVNFAINKTILSFFNIVHAFFFVPFSVVLISQGYPAIQVIGWHLAILGVLFCNNFLNIFVNNKDTLFYSILAVFITLGGLKYYGVFDITPYAYPIFKAFYDTPYFALIPLLLLGVLYKASHNYFKKNFYLDAGLAKKVEHAQTEDFAWLNRFGVLAIFLKNDIKLLKRNKRSRTTLIASLAFIFYGLLFFTGAIEVYDSPFWRIFAGLFVSGGFLFNFGQFVPSWDSAYYPLMMSQNIRYKAYISSKWYLMVMATVVSTILAAFYLYFGWQAYAAVVVAAIYNIGVNAHMVLWGGAYVKTPIDLTSNKKAFGDKKSFNAKTLLLIIPKIGVPMIIYAIGHLALNEAFGFALVALFGIIGFLFKNKVFDIIEKVYKAEKYKTLLAYKETN